MSYLKVIETPDPILASYLKVIETGVSQLPRLP